MTDRTNIADVDSTIDVTVNDETRTVSRGATCRDLVADLTGRAVGDDGRAGDGAGLGVAVAIRGHIVPRGMWATTPLEAGVALEVVTAVQGG